MKPFNKYTTSEKERTVFFAAIAVVLTVIIVVTICTLSRGENALVKCWILCKPGSQVNVRRTPSKTGQEVGFLEVGDWFETDGCCSNGFVRCFGIGEFGEGWIYAGYVSEYEPEPVFDTYCCVAKNRVACRKWMNGPRTSNPWLKNGSDVQVFYMTEEWAITARGYIQSEWLEADPQ